MSMTRRACLSGLAALAGAPVVSTNVRAAGELLPPHMRVPSELVNELDDLPVRITLGSTAPDVTITEFFDYNCPWCKLSSRHLRELLASERDLAYTLINYPILGPMSEEAARVALAYARQKGAEDYLAFHERLFGLTGTVDGSRARDVAVDLGAEKDRLVADAASEPVKQAVAAGVDLGNNLGARRTPSFIILTEIYQGFLSLEDKRQIIASIRRCDRVSC